jgi:hypothetical protein
MSGTKVTVMGNPWTVNTTAVSYRTDDGRLANFTSLGTAKGPLGMTGTTLTRHGTMGSVMAERCSW